jgi:hypothetical protein
MKRVSQLAEHVTKSAQPNLAAVEAEVVEVDEGQVRASSGSRLLLPRHTCSWNQRPPGRRRYCPCGRVLSAHTHTHNEQVLDWPIFDEKMKVDDAFVQRFLTEGFLTLTPDLPEGHAAKIDARLKEMSPPVVSTEEEGEALPKVVINGVERGYLVMNDEGKVTSANGKRTTGYDNSGEPVLPELDDLLEAPNVKSAMTALLGENYMVDADRGSNFTIPGRKANTDWHRDGNDKRRHHHPRMLCVRLTAGERPRSQNPPVALQTKPPRRCACLQDGAVLPAGGDAEDGTDRRRCPVSVALRLRPRLPES